jgi:hypothetical protein
MARVSGLWFVGRMIQGRKGIETGVVPKKHNPDTRSDERFSGILCSNKEKSGKNKIRVLVEKENKSKRQMWREALTQVFWGQNGKISIKLALWWGKENKSKERPESKSGKRGAIKRAQTPLPNPLLPGILPIFNLTF